MDKIKPQSGPQETFLKCNADVAIYGGAAGGGKTYALLLEPLYDIGNDKFGGVIFRRTTKQIKAEGGLWDNANDLYGKINAVPQNTELYMTFPSGAKITFAHMEYDKNRLDWQGSQIPYIGFDELTHFSWKQFSYLLSRNRSVSGARSRIRATCNPDPDSWVRKFIDWYIDDDGFAIPERSGVIRYFIADGDDIIWADTKEKLIDKYPKSIPKSFTFISSSVYDNKILLEKDPQYLANLHALPRVDRARLLDGNWNVRPSAGMYFKRSDVEIVDAIPNLTHTVRAWDQAGSIAKNKSDDPDWTAGVKMAKGSDGLFYVLHVERFRAEGSKVDRRIKNTASSDGDDIKIRLAQDPGQAGKRQARSQVEMLAGYNVTALPISGDKETRAKPVSSQWEAGNVKVLRGDWNDTFFNELENFPQGSHDDQVDALADAFHELTKLGKKTNILVSPASSNDTIGSYT